MMSKAWTYWSINFNRNWMLTPTDKPTYLKCWVKNCTIYSRTREYTITKSSSSANTCARWTRVWFTLERTRSGYRLKQPYYLLTETKNVKLISFMEHVWPCTLTALPITTYTWNEKKLGRKLFKCLTLCSRRTLSMTRLGSSGHSCWSSWAKNRRLEMTWSK